MTPSHPIFGVPENNPETPEFSEACPEFSADIAPLLANLSIEASAGTGKTYTLEQIVCRLIEQHGLGIKQILLVTYTDKAAEELRQRIRRQLGERLRTLQDSRQVSEEVEKARHHILNALSQYHSANISTLHSFFRRCLELYALETGQSLLSDNAAIDPKAQPIRDLLCDELQKENPICQHDIEMAASQLLYTKKSKLRLQQLLDYCCDPKLQNFWQGYPDSELCPGEAELRVLQQLYRDFAAEQGMAYQVFSELARSSWSEQAFGRQDSSKKPKNLPVSYSLELALQFFQRMQEILLLPANSRLDSLLRLLVEQPQHPKSPGKVLAPHVELLQYLHPENLTQTSPKFIANLGSLHSWGYFTQISTVEQFFTAFSPCLSPVPGSQHLQKLYIAKILLDLRRKITPQLQAAQQLYGVRSFGEMVEGLYRVLVLQCHGDPEALLRALRSQYRCVLVDEFQDTDPLQWQILYQIFGKGKQVEQGIVRSHNFIIVGDPKQSIYGFRGASRQLYKYVQENCDFRYRLGFNYRSNSLVVGACNHIFQQLWQGAFTPVAIGRTSKPKDVVEDGEKAPVFLLESVLGSGLAASGLEPRLRAELRLSPGLSFLDCKEPRPESGSVPTGVQSFDTAETTAEPPSADEVLSQSLWAIAGQVAALLTREPGKEYCLAQIAAAVPEVVQPRQILSPEQVIEKRPVQPEDIAILLEQNSDCATMQEHLQTLGIPASYREQHSIFAGPQSNPHAQSLYYFFLALCEPNQLQHSIRLFLSSFFELSPENVAQLFGCGSANWEFPATEEEEPKVYNRFTLSLIEDLFRWKSWVDQGLLWDTLQELFQYGRILYVELQKHQGGNLELTADIYSRILGRIQPKKYGNYAGDHSDHQKYSEEIENLVPPLCDVRRQENRKSYQNLRQLIEILSFEQLNGRLDCRGLCHFIGGEMRQEGTDPEYLQRDSSEGQAIQIMTIHKSKGLEFPIVLLGLGFKNKRADSIVLKSEVCQKEAEQSGLCYLQTAYLEPTAETLREQLQEDCAELRRLFYVGLTRASSKLYVPFHARCKKPLPYFALLQEGFGLARSQDRSLFYYLEKSLAGQEIESSGILREGLERLLSQAPEYFGYSGVPDHDFHGLAEVVLPENPTYPEEGEDGLLPAKGFDGGHPSTTTCPASDSLAGQKSAMQKRGYRQLTEDNLQYRFPVVSSYSSLQQRWEVKESPALGKLGLSPLTVGQNALEETQSSAGTAFAMVVATDFTDTSEDKERDELHVSIPQEESSEGTAAEERALIPEEWDWHELRLSPGADLGNLLHDVLECTDYQVIAQSSIATLLESADFYEELSLRSRHYFPRNWIKRAYPALCRMIWHTLHRDLAGPERGAESPPLQLCRLMPEQRQHELEFLLTIPQNVAVDNQLFSLPTLGKLEISQGFIKGFIDLLFLHQGKLYLLDWKSNLAPDSLEAWQGNRDVFDEEYSESYSEAVFWEPKYLEALQQQLYSPAALEELMNSHQYPMQYLLYLAVVYYYLKRRYAENFDYKEKFGGCYYLFLRGISAEHPGTGGVFYCKPPETLLIQILEALGLGLTTWK